MRALGRKSFVAYGRRRTLDPEAHHERLEDFPQRYLVDFRGINSRTYGFGFQILDYCAICRQAHECWLTRDGIWNLVPREHRKKRLCVNCFRALAGALQALQKQVVRRAT